VCLLNCPYCGTEIGYDDATFCPKCGRALVPEDELENPPIIQQKRSELVLVASMVTIISAIFTASIGYIGVYQYQALLDYYGSELASEFLGFLVFGVVNILCAVFAVVGATFMLKRKRLKISILGVVLLVVSVFVTYITIIQYQYGFTDILLFSEASVFMFSILSGILISASKAEFA
jgi:cation transport ATPase